MPIDPSIALQVKSPTLRNLMQKQQMGGAPMRPDARPGPYATALTPAEEAQFQDWVGKNNIPFDASPTSDYDMRGFWRAMMAGQAERSTANLHFPDTFKTPYHQSFSNESMYATGDAPHWVGNQLVDNRGNVVFDETPQPPAAAAPAAATPAMAQNASQTYNLQQLFGNSSSGSPLSWSQFTGLPTTPNPFLAQMMGLSQR